MEYGKPKAVNDQKEDTSKLPAICPYCGADPVHFHIVTATVPGGENEAGQPQAVLISQTKCAACRRLLPIQVLGSGPVEPVGPESDIGRRGGPRIVS